MGEGVYSNSVYLGAVYYRLYTRVCSFKTQVFLFSSNWLLLPQLSSFLLSSSVFESIVAFLEWFTLDIITVWSLLYTMSLFVTWHYQSVYNYNNLNYNNANHLMDSDVRKAGIATYEVFRKFHEKTTRGFPIVYIYCFRIWLLVFYEYTDCTRAVGSQKAYLTK